MKKKIKRWITKKSFEGGDDILLEQYQISFHAFEK